MIAFALKLWPFIRNNYKLIAFVVLIILVVILYLSRQSEKNRADQAEQGRDAAIQISNGLSTLSHKYKNKQGDTVIVTQVTGIPKSQVDVLLKEKELVWLKKFEGLKTLGNNLQSGETFTTGFIAKEVPERIVYRPCKDSVKAFAFDLHNEWNDIHAIVLDTPKIEIRDKYYGVIELKRPKGWFWKFQWWRFEPVSEITNSNKLIKIDSVAVFVVKR